MGLLSYCYTTVVTYLVQDLSCVMRKHMQKQWRRSAAWLLVTMTRQLISVFVFTTLIVHSLFFLYTKYHASSDLLWLYSMVNVQCWKTQGQLFSRCHSFIVDIQEYLSCTRLVQIKSFDFISEFGWYHLVGTLSD